MKMYRSAPWPESSKLMRCWLEICCEWSTQRSTGAVVSPKWDSRQFNAHSLAVAVLSDLVALELPVPYPEGAFTAGLLHDVGKLLIAIAMPAGFEAMCGVYESGGDSRGDCEMETVGV